MCKNCNWEEFVEECDRVLDRIDDLPERAEDFADGVREKIEGMRSWSTENEHVTEAMSDAVENIDGGVGRWLDRD